jgi:HSP20 family protein
MYKFNYIQDLFDTSRRLSAFDWVTTDYSQRCSCDGKEKDKLVFTAELPGFEKDEVDISYKDNKLTIKAEAKDKKAAYAYRGFSEIWKVTGEVDDVNISAKLDKGILTVTLPMITRESKSTTIKVM